MWDVTYRRVGIYIYKAGTRVLMYNIDSLDKVSRVI
jgi:hypothetical protein